MKKMILVVLFAILAMGLFAVPYYIDVTANRACDVKVEFINEYTGMVEDTKTDQYSGNGVLIFDFSGTEGNAYNFKVTGYTPLASDTQLIDGQPWVHVDCELNVDPFVGPGTPTQ